MLPSCLPSSMASSNTTGAGVSVPIYRLDDTIVAYDYADLWDNSIQNAIRITELGTDPYGGGVFVWTGTETNGVADAQSMGVDPCAAGSSSAAYYAWIHEANTGPTVPRPLYGISGVLPVPVPGIMLIME